MSSATLAQAFTMDRATVGVDQKVDQAIVRTLPHWRVALPGKTEETFLCPGGAQVTVAFDYAWGTSSSSRRRRSVDWIIANGEKVSASAIASLNQVLLEFGSEPVFSVQCFQGRFRIHLLSYSNGQLAMSKYYELS